MCKYFRFYCQEPTRDYLREKKEKNLIFFIISDQCASLEGI